MSKSLVGIIVGASRQGHMCDVPAHWIYRLAEKRSDLELELIDLGDYPLPFFDATASPSRPETRAAVAQRWAAVFERLDGFIVVIPQDDGGCGADRASDVGVPLRDFMHKPVAFIGYGEQVDLRAMNSLRALASGLQMAPMANAVHLSLAEIMSIWQMRRCFNDFPHLGRAATAMLDELSWWTHALKVARDVHAVPIAVPVAPIATRRAFTLHAAFRRAAGRVRALTDRVRDATARVNTSALVTQEARRR